MSAPAPSHEGRLVLLAAPRGFCAGVDRAVIAVERALDQYGAPVYVRKRIVHNTHVVRSLERRGAIFVEETDEVPAEAVLVLSAHGVAPVVHQEARAGRIGTIDATCPLVTKVHKEARRFAEEGYDILLIGHEGHEEVVGTMGQAPDRVHLVDGAEDVAAVRVRDEDKVAWLSQTTLSVDETQATVAELEQRFPRLQSPPSDDICYATQNRQVAVKRIAPACDLLVVVGSPDSSNSVRLVQVALRAGARAAHLVDCADDLDPSWVEGARTVGLTAGASVPEILVQEVLQWLAVHGFDEVEVVRTSVETQHFALPRELRHATREDLLDEAGAFTAATAGASEPGAAPESAERCAVTPEPGGEQAVAPEERR
ncbi:4-hydroxy-3-methylbut-2-enyl diphosphate reductase [Streptomyces sp. ODS05-4]|uniref:4-hydroxy-3-methylbut-2-enyl diphosphate reductase n=1 Tax=Streptomyces sp. ODS05-4 TaxID=2944939 RepID=UPI0035AFCA7B